MSKWEYTRGLHQIGNGIYTYLQPDGSWGLNNAGLIVDGEHSMVVDTLYGLDLTRKMLDAMKAATNAAGSIDILVNTHVNGDHCFGNQLFKGAEIIASNACAEEFATETPIFCTIVLLVVVEKCSRTICRLRFFPYSFTIDQNLGVSETHLMAS